MWFGRIRAWFGLTFFILALACRKTQAKLVSALKEKKLSFAKPGIQIRKKNQQIFSNFWITLFLRKFPIKLPNDPSYSVHVFYKGKLPKTISEWLKNIYFDHYNLINKEESKVQIWHESTISS